MPLKAHKSSHKARPESGRKRRLLVKEQRILISGRVWKFGGESASMGGATALIRPPIGRGLFLVVYPRLNMGLIVRWSATLTRPFKLRGREQG